MKLAAPSRPHRKTIFGLSFYADMADAVNDLPRIELTLDTPLDWNWYRATLTYAAILHGLRKMKNASPNVEEARAYAALVKAFSEMLCRIGDYVEVDKDDGVAQVERAFDWKSEYAHQEIIADLNDWARTGIARYRVSAGSSQWEPLGNAAVELRDLGFEADAQLFEAAFSLEWQSKPMQRTSARGLHKGLLALTRQAQKDFSIQEQTHPFVRPIAALSSLLENLTEHSHGPHFVLSLEC